MMGQHEKVAVQLSAVFCLFTFVCGSSHGNVALLRSNLKSETQKTAQSDGWKFCFEQKCRCKDDVADCSQNYGSLDFLPRLPENIKFINFSHNNLGTVPDNFFTNVTFINSVDLSSNGLFQMSATAFTSVRNISKVFIGGNPRLDYPALDPVLSLSLLQVLDIADGNLKGLPPGIFSKYPLPNLEDLNLHGNYLSLNDITEFGALHRLISLNLGYDDIEAVKTDIVLNFQVLDLEQNAILNFPQTCEKNSSLFPFLTHLNLQQNGISSITKEVCLPALEYLDLSHNSMSMLLRDGFSSSVWPRLQELHLDAMSMGIMRIERLAFNNPSLAFISLADNKIDFDLASNVDPYCFLQCHGLKTLILHGNSFSLILRDKTDQMLQTLSSLHHLDLGNGGMLEIVVDVLSLLFSLRQLSLADNEIFEIPDGAFDGMINLTDIDLSNNKLSNLKETAFNASTRERLHHLDLSGNPYICSCSMRWFQSWLLNDPALFDSSKSNYTCLYPDEDVTGDGSVFHMSNQACLFSKETYVGMCTVTSFVMLLFFIFLYFLRNRWRVRRLIHRALVGNNNNHNQQLINDRNFEYDLFVAYAEGDEEWIHRQLMPQMEQQSGLRLCLHQRDFHPGRHILDNIEDSVTLSRKVMMVFSPHFACSEWCQFELTLCQRHAMDRGEYLLVVYLHDIPERVLTPGMMAILRTSTYLQWSEEPRDAAYFWDSMRLALHDIIDNRNVQH